MTIKPSPRGEAEELAPIYVASRASLPERGQMWREFRENGASISSSWIDEDGEGESQSLAELWTRITDEIHRSVALVLYAEQGDFPLKGALIEAGIALGQNKPIVICLPDVELDATSLRPIGSWVTHPLVRRCDDIDEAVKIASSYTYLATRAAVPATVVQCPHGYLPCNQCAIELLRSLRDCSPEEAEEQRVTWELLKQDLKADYVPADRAAEICAEIAKDMEAREIQWTDKREPEAARCCASAAKMLREAERRIRTASAPANESKSV